ncbi:MAG: glycosyltransferase [Candidatus Methanomethyliaceae archaeon]
MKVLHVTPAYEPAWAAGGVVRRLSLLCRALSDLGVDVTVYATDTSGTGRLNVPVNRELNIKGVRVFYFRTEMSRAFRFSTQLTLSCRANIGSFDLVHISSTWNYPGVVASYYARRRKIPYIISPDGSMEAGAIMRKRLKKLLYLRLFEMRALRHGSAVHFVSELERKRSSWMSSAPPSFVVPCGMDFSEFEQRVERSEARKSLDLPRNALVVGYLGRLDRRKALDVLLKAFARIAGHFPTAILVLAGPDWGDGRRLQRLAHHLGLSDRVRFTGFVPPDKRTLFLAAIDLMTLTGYEGECFGYAAVEAAAAGVPVLLSDNVGVADILAADGAGVVTPVDEVSIAGALEQLLADPIGLQEMGQKGYHSVRKHFDMHVVAKRMITAYKDVLTGARSPECHWSY